MAKEFNKYFTSVGNALACKIPMITKELSFQEFEKKSMQEAQTNQHHQL